MARFKNYDWNLHHAEGDPFAARTNDDVIQALLMDLRDELQALNRIIGCHRFIAIPSTLRSIARQLKLQRRCPAHPRYTGQLKPRVNCRGCHRLYKAVWK